MSCTTVQNLDTLQDTIKAAILAHNPQDSEWCRYVRLSTRRLQRHDALKSVWKEKGMCKGKVKGKSKDKSKEGTSDTSNTKCSFCKGNDCPKSLRWPAEEKTMIHELCKLTMIDSDASVHVCPLDTGQGDCNRTPSETRPLPGAEMQQRGMRQMSCDSEAGRVTAVHSVLDMRRSIWSLGSMMNSGYDVYFAKDRRKQWERSRRDFQQWSVLRGNKTFKTVVEKEKRAGSQFDVTSRGRTRNVDKRAGWIRSPWPCDERHVGRRKTVSAHQNSHGPGDTLSCRENVAQGFGTRALLQMVSKVCCSASSG